MKVVHINESVKSNSTPNRIRLGQQLLGIDSRILTAHTDLQDENVIIVTKGIGYRILRKMDAVLKSIESSIKYKLQENMPFSFFNIGMNLAKVKEVQEADIIQLHWICGSFLSLAGVERLLKLDKPVVWVCHDNWPFTGGCHVRLGCEKYKDSCGNCPQLQSESRRDWSYRLLDAKKRRFRADNLTVVSPSTWMDGNVEKSVVFHGIKHYVIPNPIDVKIFTPMDKEKIRERYGVKKEAKIILFGAVNASTTPYKGYQYLLEALDILERDLDSELELQAIVFGSKSGDTRSDSKIPVKYLGYLSEDQMAEAYNCADVYVVPSLEDSFNNTVAESLACETPVVAFATGGITDIIEHKVNGYLAEYKNAEDLARGVRWILDGDRQYDLGKEGRKKAIAEYDLKVVAEKYVDLYRRLLS